MGRDHSTTKITAADLRGLLDTMTPPERQCATTQMSPLAIANLHAAPEHVPDPRAASAPDIAQPHAAAEPTAIAAPRPPLPEPPARMSVASSELAPLGVPTDDDASSGRRTAVLMFVGMFLASSAVGGILMAL